MTPEARAGRFIDLALHCRAWSTCARGRQHACVLANRDGRVLSIGYNGTGAGDPHCPCGPGSGLDLLSCPATHAEVNAVINAARVGVTTLDAIAYCTKEPCGPCLSALINAEVRTVYFEEPRGKADPLQGVMVRSIFNDKWLVTRGTLVAGKS